MAAAINCFFVIGALLFGVCFRVPEFGKLPSGSSGNIAPLPLLYILLTPRSQEKEEQTQFSVGVLHSPHFRTSQPARSFSATLGAETSLRQHCMLAVLNEKPWNAYDPQNKGMHVRA